MNKMNYIIASAGTGKTESLIGQIFCFCKKIIDKSLKYKRLVPFL